MAVTASQVQERLMAEVGDIDPTSADPVLPGTGLLARYVVDYWDTFSDKAAVAPRLQELYVKRALLRLVLPVLEAQVDFSEGPTGLSVKQSQRAAGRRTALTEVEAEILQVQAHGYSRVGGAVGALNTTAPVTPPLPQPGPYVDGNDPRYGGSPYLPERLGQSP